MNVGKAFLLKSVADTVADKVVRHPQFVNSIADAAAHNVVSKSPYHIGLAKIGSCATGKNYRPFMWPFNHEKVKEVSDIDRNLLIHKHDLLSVNKVIEIFLHTKRQMQTQITNLLKIFGTSGRQADNILDTMNLFLYPPGIFKSFGHFRKLTGETPSLGKKSYDKGAFNNFDLIHKYLLGGNVVYKTQNGNIYTAPVIESLDTLKLNGFNINKPKFDPRRKALMQWQALNNGCADLLFHRKDKAVKTFNRGLGLYH